DRAVAVGGPVRLVPGRQAMGAAADLLQQALPVQDGDVAPHRDDGDAELGGELGDAGLTVCVDAVEDRLAPAGGQRTRLRYGVSVLLCGAPGGLAERCGAPCPSRPGPRLLGAPGPLLPMPPQCGRRLPR